MSSESTSSSVSSSWSVIGGCGDNVDPAAIDDGSSLSTGVIVSTATEDDVISLFSTLDISDDDEMSTSIGSTCTTNSRPATIPRSTCTTNLFQAELDALADARGNNNEDDDGSGGGGPCIHSPLLPPPRQGKRLLRHSLTRRDRSAPFFAYSHIMMHHDDYIEVVRRDVDKQTGLYPKTPIDDLIPSLAMPNFRYGACDLTATLGRGKRWETVLELFETLEKDGRALRLSPRRDHRDYSDHHFRFYGTPPHVTIRFSVQPSGTLDLGDPESSANGQDVNPINQGTPKPNAKEDNLPFEGGVEYELHLTKQRNDGTNEVRRQYTFKGMSYGDRWDENRRDRARAARRMIRARARKEMTETFSSKYDRNQTGGNV